MTRSEVAAMTDAELVRRVAEKVLGWSMMLPSRSDRSITMPGSPPPALPSQEWMPLDDWNHTMQVVEAMRAKGWSFLFVNFLTTKDARAVFQIHGPAISDVTNSNPQRAVLEAALLAVEGE